MDRIQSAIEKARARRQGDEAEAQPAAAAAEARPAVAAPRPTRREPADAVKQAWQSIPQFHPSLRAMRRAHIMTFEGGPDATPFDRMRTKILQQMQANGWRRIAVTSPGSACGKTTLCLNLAFGLARQADIRTALIEMDLRRPSMAQTLGLADQACQFSTVLEGRADPQEHMLRYGDNLAFAISRAPVRNSAELLQSRTAQVALDDLEARLGLTMTIFDMPPMLGSDDMLGFASKVDCVLLVAAAESTTIKEIDVCERDLATQTTVLGVVLNKCRYPDKGDGGRYYY